MNAAKVAAALRALAAAVEETAEPVVTAPTAEGPVFPWVALKSCGLPERTARRLVRARVIAASRIGRDLFVSRDDVARYVESKRIGTDDEGHEVAIKNAILRKNLRRGLQVVR